MNLTNDSYVILIGTKNFTERYYRDKTSWLKVSARGRMLRMTAEQVLNHVLPVIAGIKPKLTIKVEHPDSLSQNERTEWPLADMKSSVKTELPNSTIKRSRLTLQASE